jgi:LAGLIDADG-like domain
LSSIPLMDRVSKQELEKMYNDKHMSMDEIASELGCAYSSVHRLFTFHGIKRRTREQGRAILRSKNPNVDLSFFETESADFYYFLGLMVTDGWVSDKGSISLSMTDRDVIDYVADKIRYTNSIFEKRSKRFPNAKPIYTISFRNQAVFEILKGYGVHPRKSLTVKFPRVPREYLKDFVRGVFDGDGSIYVKQRKDSNSLVCEFSIVSASSEFINEIGDVISAEANIDSVKYRVEQRRRRNPLFTLRVSKRPDIARLSEWLYKDDAFGMERKKEKMLYLLAG